MLELKNYCTEETEMLPLIQGFWLSHSNEMQTDAEALADLKLWSGDGNALLMKLSALSTWEAAAVPLTGWNISISNQSTEIRASAQKPLCAPKKSCGNIPNLYISRRQQETNRPFVCTAV